jgi:primosomal protein N'
MKRLCQVVLANASRHFDREWTYVVPEPLRESIDIGSVVYVPFGTRKTPSRGFVTRFLPELPDQYDEEKIRDISALLSDRPAVTEEIWIGHVGQIEMLLEYLFRHFILADRAR